MILTQRHYVAFYNKTLSLDKLGRTEGAKMLFIKAKKVDGKRVSKSGSSNKETANETEQEKE